MLKVVFCHTRALVWTSYDGCIYTYVSQITSVQYASCICTWFMISSDMWLRAHRSLIHIHTHTLFSPVHDALTCTIARFTTFSVTLYYYTVQDDQRFFETFRKKDLYHSNAIVLKNWSLQFETMNREISPKHMHLLLQKWITNINNEKRNSKWNRSFPVIAIYVVY